MLNFSSCPHCWTGSCQRSNLPQLPYFTQVLHITKRPPSFKMDISRRKSLADTSGHQCGVFVCFECSSLFSLLHLLSGLAGSLFLYPPISAFLHLASRSVTSPRSRLPLAVLPALEIVSLALGLITVLSRSVSLSFRGVDCDPLS